MYDSEAEAIRELAKSPCIILGRCASDILKDRLKRPETFSLRRQRRPYIPHHGAGIPHPRGGQRKVESTDKERAAYYYEHTGKTWGDVNDYHMILNTSELGVENCADILMHYFEKLEYI